MATAKWHQSKRNQLMKDREVQVRECAKLILTDLINDTETELKFSAPIINLAYRLLLFENCIRRNGKYSLTEYGKAKMQNGAFYLKVVKK